MKNMNPSFNELVQLILEICPNAVFSEDVEGQIVINTNLLQTNEDSDQPLKDMGEWWK